MTPRSNENLAEWLLMLYVLKTINDCEKKPRYKQYQKKHLDGVEINHEFIEPYRNTLRKYIDVCELIENTEALEVMEFDHISHIFHVVGDVVADKIEI